jgi:hypothetical protein
MPRKRKRLKSEPNKEIGQKGHFWMDTVYFVKDSNRVKRKISNCLRELAIELFAI